MRYVIGVAYVETYDPQGSIVQSGQDLAAGQSQYARATYCYDGWGNLAGNILYAAGTEQIPIQPSGFGGQWGYYTDQETGLVLLGARYYDPGTGRFLNRDPIGYNGGQNLYAFCGNNPITGSDPSGLDTHVFETDSYILVNTQLQFQGPKANAANAKRFVQDILQAWNKGFTYDGKPVRFHIDYTVGGDALDHYDQVYVEPGDYRKDEKYTSYVQAVTGPGSYLLDQSKVAYWPQQTKIEHLYIDDPDIDWVATHEFAHILGYKDEYKESRDPDGKRVTTPIPGFEDSILAARYQPVDERIIKLWGDYFRGHRGSWINF